MHAGTTTDIEWPSGSRGEYRSAGSRTTVYRVARAVGSPPRGLAGTVAFCFPSSASSQALTAAGRLCTGVHPLSRGGIWYELPSAPLLLGWLGVSGSPRPSALWGLATRGTFEPLLISGASLRG